MALTGDVIMPPTPEPVEIEYKRYRNKRKGYVVVVMGVTHRQGAWGWHSTVTVQAQDTGKRVSWPAPTFLRTFEPQGHRMRVKSIWERIAGRDKY